MYMAYGYILSILVYFGGIVRSRGVLYLSMAAGRQSFCLDHCSAAGWPLRRNSGRKHSQRSFSTDVRASEHHGWDVDSIDDVRHCEVMNLA